MESFGAGPSAGFSLPQNVQLFDDDPDFDFFEWHQNYQSCIRYFLDQAQHTGPIQAVAAFVNIRLPFQVPLTPIVSSRPTPLSPTTAHSPGQHHIPAVSLIPYIRRLIVTGFDRPAILHGFFGNDWLAGVGRLHEAERRNYLFASKSSHWLSVKDSYDMADGQHVPFLRPLQEVDEKELRSADDSWSEWLLKAEREWNEWLAMQDWALGPRAPRQMRGQRSGSSGRAGRGPRVKMETDE